ncbi:MAG: CDP-alcohol phosphatidyltransferase family protein [Rhodospirillales bacterium]
MSHNTWIHSAVRIGVRPLARTSVTPNQVTALRLFTGIAAAGLIAMGQGPFTDIGAAVLLLSMVLDRADGELARLTKKFSANGHRFDLLSDAFCNTIAFVAVGIGLRDGSILGYWAIPMGAVAGTFIALNLWMVVSLEDANGARAGELKSMWGFDADDGMLLVPVFLWLGLDVVVMILGFIFAPIFYFWAGLYFKRLHGLARFPFPDLSPDGNGRRTLQPVDRPRS